MLRRASILARLPDGGDPFGVAAFRAAAIVDDQNAFAQLRQAAGKVRPMPKLTLAERQASPAGPWSQAGAGPRGWLDSNREALALFRVAVVRPNATSFPSWYCAIAAEHRGRRSCRAAVPRQRARAQPASASPRLCKLAGAPQRSGPGAAQTASPCRFFDSESEHVSPALRARSGCAGRRAGVIAE